MNERRGERRQEKPLSVDQMRKFLSGINADTASKYIKGRLTWIADCLNSNDTIILDAARDAVRSLKKHIELKGKRQNNSSDNDYVI